MRYLLKTALIGLLIISPALAKKKPPSPVITPQTVTLNANTATYSNPGSFYSVRENPSGRGSLVRGTGFQELLTLTPSTMPAGTVMNWSWPTSQGTPYSYPEIAYGNLHPGNLSPPATKANAFTTLTEQISYTEGGPALTYNMLTEMWLSLDAGWSASAFEVELQLNDIQEETRPSAVPINHHMTSPFNADVYVGLTPQIDGSIPILIYPETIFTALGNNPTLSGSAAGTPGTAPTNCYWSDGGTGLTRTIGTASTAVASDGTTVNYVPVRYHGTSTGSAVIFMGLAGNWPASTGNQRWLGTQYVAIAAGSITNINSIYSGIRGYNSSFSYQDSVGSGNIAPNLTSTLQRFGESYVSQGSAVAYTDNTVELNVSTGKAVDITLWVGLGGHAGLGYDPVVQLNNTTVNWNSSTGIYGDLIAAGDITGNEYAHGFEIGPEVYNGVGSLTINSFNVTWN